MVKKGEWDPSCCSDRVFTKACECVCIIKIEQLQISQLHNYVSDGDGINDQKPLQTHSLKNV